MPSGPALSIASSLLKQRNSFLLRARALFWGRIAINSLYLLLWLFSLIDSTLPFHHELSTLFIIGIGYILAAISLYFTNDKKLSSIISLITLMIDCVNHLYLTSSSGYLLSPLMALHPFLTASFLMLFNNPLIIVLPLINLPVATILSLSNTQDASILSIIGAMLLYCALNALTIFFIYLIHGQEQHLSHSLITTEEELKKLMLMQERQRISREFHDGVGAYLTSIVMQCDIIKKTITHSESLKDVHEIQHSAIESIDDMRRSIAFLNDNFDVAEQVFIMCQNIQNRHNISVIVKNIEILSHLPLEHQLPVCRIIQEALANALKHSRGTQITLDSTVTDGHHVITIKDDGVGFIIDEKMPHHYGLLNMKTRATQIAAHIAVDSALQRGTTVALRLPKRSQSAAT